MRWRRVCPMLIIRLRSAAWDKPPRTGERRWNPLSLITSSRNSGPTSGGKFFARNNAVSERPNPGRKPMCRLGTAASVFRGSSGGLQNAPVRHVEVGCVLCQSWLTVRKSAGEPRCKRLSCFNFGETIVALQRNLILDCWIEGINVRILLFINQNPRLIKFQFLTLLTRFTGLNLSTAWYRIKHEGRETRETLAIVPLMLWRFLPPN